MKVAISIGGSLLTKDADLKDPESFVDNFKSYSDVIKSLYNKGHELVVVCGGGFPARLFQDIGRKFTDSVEMLDRLGIVGTDLNAYLFVAVLGDLAYHKVLKDPVDVKAVYEKTKGKKVIVCSGWEPGGSTDLDATMHADEIGAKLVINATDIDGIYTTDPDKDPTAEKLPKLNYKRFRKIISKVPQTPGEYRLFDLKAIDILERCKIKLAVIDGRDPEEIARAVEGKHSGSIIG